MKLARRSAASVYAFEIERTREPFSGFFWFVMAKAAVHRGLVLWATPFEAWLFAFLTYFCLACYLESLLFGC